MEKIGTFYSWEIVSDCVAIKTGDDTLKEAGESGVPREIYWFFECGSMVKGQKEEIALVYDNEEYKATLRVKNDDVGRVNLSWRGDLHDKLKAIYSQMDEYPVIRFEKISGSKFYISLINFKTINADDNIPIESFEWITGKEGKKKVFYTTKYERDPKLREAAIKIHGCTCEVCGFNFEEKYGEIGRDFIEVHHKKPLSETAEERIIDPANDLICLCSNCHRMIHRRKDHALSIEELKKIINEEGD